MSDFTISDSVLVNLDFSLWSGRAKLDELELPEAAKSLPPKELYNAGSIKIFDTDYLKPFRNFKTRADVIVGAVGCRLMGGWLVDANNMAALEEQLADCHSDWSNALAGFMQEYPQRAHAWACSCGRWESLVRQKQPAARELWQRFRFDWQTFRLMPDTTHAVSRGNSTGDLVSELPDKALQSVIDSLKVLYDASFNKQTDPSGKAYAALKKIAQRAQALGFANPQAARLAPVLLDLVSQKNHTLSRLVLSRMAVPQDVADILAISDGQGLDSLLSASEPAEPAPELDSLLSVPEPAESAPELDNLLEQARQMLGQPVPEPTPIPVPKPAAAPVQTPLSSMDVLDSLGLF